MRFVGLLTMNERSLLDEAKAKSSRAFELCQTAVIIESNSNEIESVIEIGY